MQINWYPGHMAKAKRELLDSLKLIDVVIELVDARAPAASRNPDFDSAFSAKKRIILLNKSDLADDAATARWIRFFTEQGIPGGKIVSSGKNGRKQALELIDAVTREDVERMQKRGVRKTVRALVVGIPNVGKSTFINCIAMEQRAKVGDKPGVTRGKQWVRITPYLELLDSPGLLWPKLENQEGARHLACLGSINDDILDVEELAAGLLQELMGIAPSAVLKRYPRLETSMQGISLLEAAARFRGYLLKGGICDTERAARMILEEFRKGSFGRITLETPDTGEAGEQA